MIAKLKIILLLVFLCGILPASVFGQFISNDNFTGIFSDNNSWINGTAPNPASINSTTNIYGYITSNSSLTIAKKTNFTVYDTLIIHGNLNISLDANFNIEAGAICIVYGNVDAENKVELQFGSHFVVTGDFKATGNSTVEINPGAAVYILGDVNVVNMPELECNSTCHPEEYVPPGNNCCARGDIISMEDNENNDEGIYDFFVEGDMLKGVAPVYSELCGSESVVISALFTNGTNYQWRDSLGNVLENETSIDFTADAAGEYFATFDYNGITYTTHRAKVVTSTGGINASYNYTDETCPGEADGSIVIYSPSVGYGSYEYTINGGVDWFSDGAFSNLSAGSYNVQVREAGKTCVTVLNSDLKLVAIDTEQPTITCPTDLIITTDEGSCEATGVDLGNPLTSDNCSVASVTNNASEPFALGNITVTWTVKDDAGNTATCDQEVTVEPASVIDIAISNLGNSCQEGPTGTSTLLEWTLSKTGGVGDWFYSYTIEDESIILESGNDILTSGSSATITFEVANETSVDKPFTITISNVKDACDVSETELSNNNNSVILYGLPDTGDIITD